MKKRQVLLVLMLPVMTLSMNGCAQAVLGIISNAMGMAGRPGVAGILNNVGGIVGQAQGMLGYPGDPGAARPNFAYVGGMDGGGDLLGRPPTPTSLRSRRMAGWRRPDARTKERSTTVPDVRGDSF